MADEPTDEQRLLELAGAVSDARQLDWDALASAMPETRDRALLDAMHVLAKVGDIARFGDPLPPDDLPAMTANAATGEPGRRSWGRLHIETDIGRGSFGTVHKAWDTVLEQHVALKLLHTDGAAAPPDAQRALDEARMLARVAHPGIVRVLGVETHHGQAGLWMELITGRTLEDVLQANGPFGADEARHIGIALCRALAAVHKAGLVHQDVKAHNVMREDGGRIVLMDLGAGRPTTASGADRTAGTGGTPLYLAPEVAGGQPPSASSDIYSLGVLLFHLVTGTYPVEGRNHYEIQQAHARGRRQRLRDLRPDLPVDFVHAVECALAPEPRDRFTTAGELELALAGQRPHVAPGNSLIVILAAGAVVTAIAASLWFSSNNRSAAPSSVAEPNAAINTAPTANDGPAAARREDGSTRYRVRAAFYRRNDSQDELLTPGGQLGLNDKISLKLQTSAPVFVYVVNQDDKGVSHLLYPLDADLTQVRPFTAGEWIIPPQQASGGWVVNSVGGREHFLVAVSPTRLAEFEDRVRDLPRPKLGAETAPRQLPAPALGSLRGLGGLAPAPVTAPALLPFLDVPPLTPDSEDTVGAWLRRATFANP